MAVRTADLSDFLERARPPDRVFHPGFLSAGVRPLHRADRTPSRFATRARTARFVCCERTIRNINVKLFTRRDVERVFSRSAKRGFMIGEPLFDSGSIAWRVAEIGAAISTRLRGEAPAAWSACSPPRPLSSPTLSGRLRSLPDGLDRGQPIRRRPVGSRLEKDVAIPIGGRHVILVDDTVDTGMTLQYVVKTPARSRAGLAGGLRAARPAPPPDCRYRDQVQGVRSPRRIRRGLRPRLSRTLSGVARIVRTRNLARVNG